MMGVAAAIMMLLTACSSMTGKTLGENIDDAGITATVKAKLAGEKISTVIRIDVGTNQGVVVLNGTVSSEAMRVRAVEIGRGVKGGDHTTRDEVSWRACSGSCASSRCCSS